jgi:DNA-binding LytR/AlgR family response regulator
MTNPRRELHNAILPLEAKAYAQINDCKRIALVILECRSCKMGIIFSINLPLDISTEPDAFKSAYFIVCNDRKSIENIPINDVVYMSKIEDKYLVVVDNVDAIPETLSQCKRVENYTCIEEYEDLVQLIK